MLVVTVSRAVLHYNCEIMHPCRTLNLMKYGCYSCHDEGRDMGVWSCLCAKILHVQFYQSCSMPYTSDQQSVACDRFFGDILTVFSTPYYCKHSPVMKYIINPYRNRLTRKFRRVNMHVIKLLCIYFLTEEVK